MSRFLTERHQFAHMPKLAGQIDFHMPRAETRDVGILQAFVPNQGDAWQFTVAELNRYFENAATAPEPPQLPAKRLVDLLDEEPDQTVVHHVGAYLDAARLLGQRIAELHLTLLEDDLDPSFIPEPFTALYQRSAYQSMRNLLGQVMRTLSSRLSVVPDMLRAEAQAILANQNRIGARFDAFLERRLVQWCGCARIGVLRVGQVLCARRRTS